MKKEELRLELVKLTYTHGRDVAEALGRAKELEKYVSEEIQSPSEAKEVLQPNKLPYTRRT
jgi:hypothetical protein